MHLLLRQGASAGFLIQPSWPSRRVLVSAEAYLRLCNAQQRIGRDTSLILKRGMESPDFPAVLFRKLLRFCGGGIFAVMYPCRARERLQIFTPNGHDRSGDHVDVGIWHAGAKLRLLPYGVFTPLWLVHRIEAKYRLVLSDVRSALEDAGLTIHSNRTEALQIHCDLNMPTKQPKLDRPLLLNIQSDC
jgi:hypothetical protein